VPHLITDDDPDIRVPCRTGREERRGGRVRALSGGCAAPHAVFIPSHFQSLSIAQAKAEVDEKSDILIFRHHFRLFSVSLTPAVPYSFIHERDHATLIRIQLGWIEVHPTLTSGRSEMLVRIGSGKQFLRLSAEHS
jgi:hypothetical protein